MENRWCNLPDLCEVVWIILVGRPKTPIACRSDRPSVDVLSSTWAGPVDLISYQANGACPLGGWAVEWMVPNIYLYVYLYIYIYIGAACRSVTYPTIQANRKFSQIHKKYKKTSWHYRSSRPRSNSHPLYGHAITSPQHRGLQGSNGITTPHYG